MILDSRAPRCRTSAGTFIELSIIIEGQHGHEVSGRAIRCFAAFTL